MAIDLESIKNMNPKMKALLVGLVMILGAYAFWFLYLNAAIDTKSELTKKLDEVQKDISAKQAIASQKQKFLNEIKDLRELFNIALAKLPEQREIPGLFLSVSEAGKEAGVEFVLFEPKAPEKAPPPKDVKANLKPSDQRADQQAKDQKPADAKADASKTATAKKPAEPEKFYEEIPVRVSVNGGFHNTAIFFDKVAKLSRIVNIEDISIGDGKDVKGRGRVVNTSCVIKTYMFLEKKDAKTQK
jgi:type IV pilus assembly protein PilO